MPHTTKVALCGDPATRLVLTHAIAAFLFHLFLDLIVFFLLIVVQDRLDLRHGLLVNVAHLGEVFAAIAGAVIADGFYLGTLAFEDRLDFGLLIVGQSERLGEFLKLVVDSWHLATGGWCGSIA